MEIKESKFIKKLTAICFALFMFTCVAPVTVGAIGLDTADHIAQISESNPYQSLVYALGSMCVVCVGALGYVYNQNQNSVKEQYTILKSLSDNMAVQNIAISKNQEIIEKSLDVVNDKLGSKPCLLDSNLISDLIKHK